MIEQIISGIIGGIVYSFAGYANKPIKERFDWQKISTTFIVAIVVGAVTGYLGTDYGIVANTAVVTGFTVVIDKFVKALIKKFKK